MPHEGRFAVVTKRGAGCDGRFAASGGSCPPGENAAAYGEIVWSWRRDPGVYPVRLCGLGNGDNKGRSPGRARISRKPLRGEGRDVLAVPVKSVCVFSLPIAHGDAGAVGAGLPAPLFREGATKCKTSGKSCRENENCCFHVIASVARQSSFLRRATRKWIASSLRSRAMTTSPLSSPGLCAIAHKDRATQYSRDSSD